MKKLIIYLDLILMANCFLTGCIKDDSTSFQIDMPDVTIAPDDAIAFAVGTEGERILLTTISCGPTTDVRSCRANRYCGIRLPRPVLFI